MTVDRMMRRAVALLAVGAMALPLPAMGQTQAQRISLDQAIQIAIGHSRDIAQAEATLHGANGQVREAWASVLPDIRASASYTRNFRIPEQFIENPFDPDAGLIALRFGADNAWQAGLTLSQPLFEVTAFIGLGAAGRFRNLQREFVRGVSQSVVTTVRGAYFAVLLAFEQVRLTDQSVTRVRQTLEETRAMNRAGLASDYDVLRLEVQLGNLEPDLRRARDAVGSTTRTLAVSMGLEAETPLEVEGRLHEMVIGDLMANSPENRMILAAAGSDGYSEGEFDDAYGVAVRDRSDLRQARLNIELERARYAVERAEYFPKISVFSNYTIQAQENNAPSFFGNNICPSGPETPENPCSRKERSWSLSGGIRVELPIFTGFSRSARMQQASANIVQNEALLALTEQQASNQIRTLLAGLAETRDRVASQGRAVEQAQRGFEIASAEYREGIGSQLQITDAEVALRQSEFNYAQAVYDYLLARANLDAARGTVPIHAEGVAAPLQSH